MRKYTGKNGIKKFDPNNTQSDFEDPEVPHGDSESTSRDNESFMHNPSELEFLGTCEDKGYAYVHFVLVDVNPDIQKQKIIGKYLV